MDEIIRKIASLGVPGLILLVAIELTGLPGAAAITTALSALGPGGMLGGIMTLCTMGLIVDALVDYGFDAIALGVITELIATGESKESIKAKICKYPITFKMKNHLLRVLEKI